MPRNTNPPKRSEAECLALVTAILDSAAAYESAWQTLRSDICEYVEGYRRLPVDWLNDSERARITIAQQVLQQLEADRHRVLADWRTRVLEGRDQATFWRLIKTVVVFVAVDYARRAECRPDVAPRARRGRR